MRGDFAAIAPTRRLHGLPALLLALAILALDVLSPLQGAVAVLYTIVVLVASRSRDRALTVAAALFGAALAILGYVVSHLHEPLGSPAMRLGVSLVAIAITAALSLRNFGALERQRQADQRYRTLFESAGFPMWEADWSAIHERLQQEHDPQQLVEFASRHAVVRDLNDAAADLFGVSSRNALIGGTIYDHRTPASQRTLGNIIRGLREGQTTIREETQFRNRGGALVDVILRVTLPPDHDGWKRVLVMALDVTQRNLTQVRLDQAQAELAHVSRVNLLGQLSASIAHEINQPLSAIITYANSGKRWLSREAPGAIEVADCLDHIGTNGKRAADVIARIRDMSRKAEPRYERFALAPLIDETVALLRRDLQSHEVGIVISAEPGARFVQGDRVQIQQVLMNLMLNADQSMAAASSGGRELRLSSTCHGENVVIEIRDTGPGIAGDPEALFASFFTTKAEGMGMGLSICRAIVERHGGRLTAENHVDGGAVFRFGLPVGTNEGDRV
ncbi:sensor histidine kinase [Flavisphingomonas formosensis]|uniref:sensor histidine kinase n=1 Tax=Flavisphingomonas formosensis TaxID=861534 RepID=UPI0012F7761C|nr:ATP-binding protein [Sphingomonas formosensis]